MIDSKTSRIRFCSFGGSRFRPSEISFRISELQCEDSFPIKISAETFNILDSLIRVLRLGDFSPRSMYEIKIVLQPIFSLPAMGGEIDEDI